MSALERDIQFEIREALGLEPGLVLWRNSVGTAKEWDAKKHTQRVIRYGLAPGSADLVGIVETPVILPATGAAATLGRFFALEVKRPGKNPEADQRLWAQLVRSNGGFVATVRSVDEARAELARARREAGR